MRRAHTVAGRRVGRSVATVLLLGWVFLTTACGEDKPAECPRALDDDSCELLKVGNCKLEGESPQEASEIFEALQGTWFARSSFQPDFEVKPEGEADWWQVGEDYAFLSARGPLGYRLMEDGRVMVFIDGQAMTYFEWDGEALTHPLWEEHSPNAAPASVVPTMVKKARPPAELCDLLGSSWEKASEFERHRTPETIEFSMQGLARRSYAGGCRDELPFEIRPEDTGRYGRYLVLESWGMSDCDTYIAAPTHGGTNLVALPDYLNQKQTYVASNTRGDASNPRDSQLIVDPNGEYEFPLELTAGESATWSLRFLNTWHEAVAYEEISIRFEDYSMQNQKLEGLYPTGVEDEITVKVDSGEAVEPNEWGAFEADVTPPFAGEWVRVFISGRSVPSGTLISRAFVTAIRKG